MEREVWEELVDRVVDDECTDEERRALEEAAERNPEIRAAFESAERIREIMRRSAGATVPPEFSERLRLAIERSDFWVDREIERPTARPASTVAAKRLGGRRLLWAATGAAVAFAAVAAVALLAPSVDDEAGGNRREIARYDKTGEIEKPKTGGESGKIDVATSDGEQSATERLPRLPIRTPQNKLTIPETSSVPYSDGFYTRRVLDSANARRQVAAFLQVCRENNVKYEKIGGDFELLLMKTTKETRSVILRWLDENVPEIAPRAENSFAETWRLNDESKKNVRVSFFVSAEGSVNEDE